MAPLLPLPDPPASLLFVSVRESLPGVEHGFRVIWAPPGDESAAAPPDCVAVVVQRGDVDVATLRRWKHRAETLGVPLVGLLTQQCVAPSTEEFDFLIWAGASLTAQLQQGLRWYAQPRHMADARGGALRARRRLDFFKPYADFFRHSADGMVVISDSGDVLYANPAAKTFAREQLHDAGTNVLTNLQKSDRRHAVNSIRALRSGGSPISANFTLTTSSGPRVLNVSASRLLRSSPALLLAFRDVTTQYETERALRHTNDFLERVIDSSVDAIVSADLQGNILVFNRAASRIFGYPPGTVMGRLNVRDLYPPGGAHAVMRRIKSPQDGGVGRLEGYETLMLDKQGQTVPVRLSAAIVREDGRPVATVGVFTDIRQELAMRERLTRAEADLREREKGTALAELAGMTAHELNQPLTCVLSYSELLQRRCKDADVTNAAAVIVSQAQRMAEIVRRLGRITRYETKAYVGGATILDLDKSTPGGGDT